MTSQRRLIVGLIQEARAPVDAATLLDLAQQQDSSVDRATVYRTLSLLREKGLIDAPGRAGLPGGLAAHAAGVQSHGRLVCIRCRAVHELSSEALDALRGSISKKQEFDASSVRLDARGLCAACLSLSPRAPGSASSRAAGSGSASGNGVRAKRQLPGRTRRK